MKPIRLRLLVLRKRWGRCWFLLLVRCRLGLPLLLLALVTLVRRVRQVRQVRQVRRVRQVQQVVQDLQVRQVVLGPRVLRDRKV